MQCLQCGAKVPVASRTLGSFCSYAHRSAYYQRSLRKSGLSQSLGGFQALAPAIGVIGIPEGRPYKAESSSSIPGVWHLSSMRTRGIPAMARFSARTAQGGVIVPARRLPAVPAIAPKITGHCVVPEALQDPVRRPPERRMPPQSFARSNPRSAMPSSYIRENSAATRQRRGRRSASPGCSLVPRTQGPRRRAEKVIAPGCQAPVSRSGSAREGVSRLLGSELLLREPSGNVLAVPEFRHAAIRGKSELTLPQLAPAHCSARIADSGAFNISALAQTALEISRQEFEPVPSFPPHLVFRPQVELPARHAIRSAWPETSDLHVAGFDVRDRISLPAAPSALGGGLSPRTASIAAPLSPPRPSNPRRVETLPAASRMVRNNSTGARGVWVRAALFGIPAGMGAPDGPLPVRRSVRHRLDLISSRPAIPGVRIAEENPVAHVERLRLARLSIEAAAAAMEPAQCRQRTPAVRPDLIPEPGPATVFHGSPAPGFVVAPALHHGVGPAATRDFLRLRNRLARPPLLVQSHSCEFPFHTGRLGIARLSIEAAAAAMELPQCRQRTPAVRPDLIPEPGPATVFHGSPAPGFVVAPALQHGVGPAAIRDFLRLRNRLARPPLLVQSHSCEFPFQTAIRYSAATAMVALREAGQVTSPIRVVPDSPANLILAQRISITRRGLLLADVSLAADAKTDIFVRHAIEPITPGEGPIAVPGEVRAVRGARVRIARLTIEAASGIVELTRCRERMPAVIPDLIPLPSPVHAFRAAPAPDSLLAPALRNGIGPLIIGRFQQVKNRASRPSLLMRAEARQFPSRPPMQCAAVPSPAILRDAGQSTSLIRLVPESPAHLAYPENIRIQSGVAVPMEPALGTDCSVDLFRWRVRAPMAPAEAQARATEAMPVARADRLRVSRFTLEAAAGAVELARCAERRPALRPDLILIAGPLRVSRDAAAPASALAPALHRESAPPAFGRFSHLSQRPSQPPVLSNSLACDFSMQPAIRFTAEAAPAAMRESGQLTTEVRLVPDSPAAPVRAPHVLVTSAAVSVTELEFPVESFAWPLFDPAAPSASRLVVTAVKHVSRATPLRLSRLLIEAAAKMEPLPCREQAPALSPDLIPVSLAIRAFRGSPAPASDLAPALRGGVGPAAIRPFLPVDGRVWRPALIIELRPRKFLLRPAIRCAVAGTPVMLREAGQVTSLIRFVPDSPASRAFRQRIADGIRNAPALSPHLVVDAKVDSFVWRAMDPLVPVEAQTSLLAAMRVMRTTDLSIARLSIEPEIGTIQLIRSPERVPALRPDPLSLLGPMRVSYAAPARPLVLAPVLHSGVGPTAVPGFSPVNARRSQPPVLLQTREREFKLRPAIRHAATLTPVALRGAGQLTSETRPVPDSPANLAHPENTSARRVPASLAVLHLPIDAKVDSFVSRAIEPHAPFEGAVSATSLSSREWTSSIHAVPARFPVNQRRPVPAVSEFATMLPPQASWSSVLEGLRERIFSPRIRSAPRRKPGELILQARKAGLAPSMLPVPLDFRWQRKRTLWDRAGRWKHPKDSTSLPDIAFYWQVYSQIPSPEEPESRASAAAF